MKNSVATLMPGQLATQGLLLIFLIGGCMAVAAAAAGDVALAAISLTLVATPLVYYQPLMLVAIPILLAPLLGRTGESLIGPLNAMSILALWFLALGTLLLIHRLREFLQERLFLILFGLLCVTALSVGVSPMKGVSLAESVRMASALMMLPMAYFLAENPDNRRRITLLVFLSALIPLCMGFYQIISGDIELGDNPNQFQLESELNRIYATFFDVHPYAKYLMILLPPALVMLLLERRSSLSQFAWSIVTAALFINLIFTYARSQLIGFLLAAVAILYRLNKINLKTLIFALPLVLALFAVTGVFDRFGDLTQGIDIESNTRENSVKGRLLIWQKGLPLAIQQPALGHGAATFQHDIGIKSHNVYLGLFYEVGALGALLYLWALLHSAWLSWRCHGCERLHAFDRKLALAMYGLSLAVVVVSLVENYIQATVMWWMYFALLGCVLRSGREAGCY